MPFKIDKINLKGLQDRRRKLLDADKDTIRNKYATGFYSLSDLAKDFGVSKKTILLTVNPTSKAKNDKRIEEHWKDYKPSKEERNSIMREHRQYKQNLYLKGELKDDIH